MAPPPPPKCPPCHLELDVARLKTEADRLARGQATLRADMGDTRARVAHLETLSETFAVHMDRLGDAAQRIELTVARLEGAVDVLTDRPSVVVQTPPERRSVRTNSLEIGNGRWRLQARGMLPALLVVVLLGAALAVWAMGR